MKINHGTFQFSGIWPWIAWALFGTFVGFMIGAIWGTDINIWWRTR